MTRLPLLQVDAFADQPLSGNPCAVVLDADALDAPTMLAVAREMNLSETAFVRRSARADFGARYFTPAEEIPLAGHPTLATVHALVEWGRIVPRDQRVRATLELPAGVIEVEVHFTDGRVREIVMNQLPPAFGAQLEAAEALPLFGLEPDDALPGAKVQVVSTGARQLMVPLRGLEPLRRARLDPAGFAALRRRLDIFGPHLFCLETPTGQGTTFARHLGLPPDVAEDPFTGSATGGMGAYLWRYGLLEQPRFVAEQGHWLGRPGRARVEVVGPRHAIETVRVGGATVTVLRGELDLGSRPGGLERSLEVKAKLDRRAS